jgi:predicted alpha/beta superfamily hydrolase
MSEGHRRSTILEVHYPLDRGEVGLRGNRGGLSWDHSTPPTARRGGVALFELDLEEFDVAELRLMRGEHEWALGRKFIVHAGDRVTLEPSFDHQTSTILPMEPITATDPAVAELLGGPVAFDVLLPPSYVEQEKKRFPVVYALDGQSLWSFSEDPFGVWHLDKTLDNLFALGAMTEVIVVALRTDRHRLERLSPVPDGSHGGGHGPRFLDLIVDRIKPVVDARFRTDPEREATAILGSSMGGLFAFWAAWTRPDVFGKAACLSGSFWWGQRALIKHTQSGACPAPRPQIYLDSGASVNPQEHDPNVRDGFQHTQSLVRALIRHCYERGVDLHRLTFTGETHNAAAWAARVSIPLQLLFPLAPPGETSEAMD